MCRLWQVCWTCLFAYLLLGVSVTESAVAERLVLTHEQEKFSATPVVEYLEDPSRQLSFQQVTNPNYHTLFKRNTQSQVNFGRSRSAWWVRFEVQNQTELAWYLLLDSSLGDEFNLYMYPNGQPTNQTVDFTNFYAKPVADYMRHAWKVALPKGQTLQVYMRVTNGDSILALPISFLSEEEFISYSLNTYRVVSFIYASMIVLGLYQLFMFFVLRETNYLLLAIYMFAMVLTIHRTNPIFSELAFLSKTGSYFFTAPFLIMLAAHAEFTRRVLDMRDYAPKINQLYKIIVYLALGLIFITGAIPFGTLIPLAFTVCLLLLSMATSYYIAAQGNRLARYFAWIYWIPLSIHLPGLGLLLFESSHWVASLDALVSLGTLVFMLMLSVLQAERVRLLREQMKQVEAASAAKEQFLAVMSHELRTPMHAILGITTLLKLSTLNHKQKIYLGKLESATEHIMQLINNVLDYAKLSSYTFQLKPEACQLSLALQASLPLAQQQAEQKGLQFMVESSGDLDATVLVDRTCLTQILLNLLTNAVKYTAEGSVTLKVKVSEAKQGEQLVSFAVTDTGEGMLPEQLPYLFEPYTQLAPQNVRRGVGLGLAISKRLVEAMGAELQVSSQLGKGSEFKFELILPIAQPLLSTTLHDQDRLTRGLRLLVADSSELNHPETSEMLRRLGAEVQIVPNGQRAILCLQEHDVDMVLVDMNLPDLNGLELSRWVRHSGRNPKLPIVAITSNTVSELEWVCREVGINAYLHKPLDYQSLSATLNRALAA